MKKARITVLVAAFAGAGVVLTACSPFCPRRSEESLRENLLKDVPLGSSMLQVQEQIGRLDWKIEVIDLESGFHDQRLRPSVITGAKSIEAYAGHYQGFPWRADVSVHWAFDERGRLTDIWVWKTFDSL